MSVSGRSHPVDARQPNRLCTSARIFGIRFCDVASHPDPSSRFFPEGKNNKKGGARFPASAVDIFVRFGEALKDSSVLCALGPRVPSRFCLPWVT